MRPRTHPGITRCPATQISDPARAQATPAKVAKTIKTYVEAGLRVPKILDYGAMAGLTYAAASAANVLAAEDELMRLCGDIS